ncbi:hypothetical protein LUZ63_002402 [Rhynchospora breviuscula]|uniref:Galactose-1-phosphate uridyl transferase N-terminal domain-containing protein n=1 Tax=Rhynchospora breviuscula TaxID=2022672 RepID=A0A9Q0CYP2_9POAL|nr:hypothetical protein LUZ63_002402 [Rhynchospora breviuscula]
MSSSSEGETQLPNRTSEIRKDTVFGRWVVFSPARSRRPSDFKSKNPNPTSNPTSCPFCIGRESECAPEIFRVPPSTPDWTIRVIENLYPALRRDLNPPHTGSDQAVGACRVTGFGFHDVVIETPYHPITLSDLEPEAVGEVLLVYVERVRQLKALGSLKYVQVFKNHGAAAGASMTHSHSQIMGIPVIPPSVTTRLSCMKEIFDLTGKCSVCDLQSDQDLMINSSTHFYAIAPFASSYAFEIWIVPREHSADFHELDHSKAMDLGGLLKLMLQKLAKQLNNPPFNFVIHTAPFDLSPSCVPYSHWFLQIVPHMGTIAGFELGTGCYINPIFPEDAAKVLREVDG